MTDPILTKTPAGVTKDWLRKEIEDIKSMLDQIPVAVNLKQHLAALDYCEQRIIALRKLSKEW